MPIRAALALGALLVPAILALGLAQSDRGHALLRAAGLTAPREPFTALAFARPDDLPLTPPAGAEIPVSFEVTNQEDGHRDYAWRVTERSAGTVATLASGRVGIDRGARATVRASVPLACTGPRARVAVELGEPARMIGFWVACPGSESPS